MTTIDDTGFHRTRLDERLAELEASWRTVFGSDIDLRTESPDGQVLGTLSEAIADIDECLEIIYNERSPAAARGAALSRLCALNGVFRKPGAYSTAPITLGGTPGTPVPAGSLIGSTNTDAEKNSIFQTTALLTIGVGGNVNGTVRSTVAGAVPAGAGNLTKVLSVVDGWDTAINSTAATLGSPVESDPKLRVRRAASVAISSQGILDGLRAALNQITDVLEAEVYENPTDDVDANGLPPHSIHAIVLGGEPEDIGQVIWEKKSLGVTQVGAEAVTITDDSEMEHVMRFDRPATANIYVRVELTELPNVATVNALKAAIVAWGDANSKIGADVVRSQLYIPINTIPGLSVEELFIDDAPSPASTNNLVIPYDAVATWDVDNIEVVEA